MRKGSEDRRLVRLTKICLGLPEASRQMYGQHAQFLVRKKTFAYFLNDHHGDGMVAVTGKALPGDNSLWLRHSRSGSICQPISHTKDGSR